MSKRICTGLAHRQNITPLLPLNRSMHVNRIMIILASCPQRLVMLGIRGYQYLISPLLPAACRFYPTCSHYSLEAYHRFGFFKGTLLSIIRLLKCHPFHPGGLDPVPDVIHDSLQNKTILWKKIHS